MAQRKPKRGPLQFLQFGVIGFANAGIDIGTLNLLLILFHTDDRILLLLYNTIAYTLAVANSYYWNASITFKRSAQGSNRQRILFIAQGLISLGVSNLVFLGVNEWLDYIAVPNWMRYNIAKGLAMLLSFLASFFMVKYFVFKDYGKRFIK
ncbi:Putative flippase GtrA (transmembrane translocase of bactoprenol-linked glucose) [Lentibacillus halodurans]|uniref:Putative flippase GtrA (Transmembrane translocase of bactoprenol-linked glucose) n=1 Tax=Lentibacillus halodurans TaxID=237679 RepID=A0A1I0ZT78_9BACI|nr:GtrA family protein [Lentibacillus halodurans]SFB28999.1 Putative flippase GtrA (transmembrane translocase of bactoprenol-linked glucose) [Lentibacillus halodurans]